MSAYYVKYKMHEVAMNGYKVLVNRFGKWYVTDHGLNRLAAECVRDYYTDRGVAARIEEEVD